LLKENYTFKILNLNIILKVLPIDLPGELANSSPLAFAEGLFIFY